METQLVSLSLTVFWAVSLSLTYSLSHFLILTLFISHPECLCLSLTLSHPLCVTFFLSYAHSHTNTLTQYCKAQKQQPRKRNFFFVSILRAGGSRRLNMQTGSVLSDQEDEEYRGFVLCFLVKVKKKNLTFPPDQHFPNCFFNANDSVQKEVGTRASPISHASSSSCQNQKLCSCVRWNF